jgi:hypothetical protein
VNLERQCDDRSDAAARIQRRIGVLENRLHAPGRLAAPETPDVFAVEHDRPAGCGNQAEQHPRKRRLATPRLADDAEDVAAPDRQVHAVHRVQDPSRLEEAAADRKRARQAACLDQRRIHEAPRLP